MKGLRGRPRLAATLVAALAMVTNPLLVLTPVRAGPVDCNVAFGLVVHGDLIIGPGVPGSPETDHRSVVFSGYFGSDPCPGDGYFDSAQIEETHSSVTLADARWEFPGTGATVDLIGRSGNLEGNVSINRDHYKEPEILGRAVFTLWVGDGNGHWISATNTFYVRREVRFTVFNASPEPVRKGSPVKVSGYLTRLGYTNGNARWIPYAGRRVEVYFHARGGSCRFRYAQGTTKATLTTSTGYFAKKVTATRDGCWNAFSREVDDAAIYASMFARETGDYVDVQ